MPSVYCVVISLLYGEYYLSARDDRPVAKAVATTNRNRIELNRLESRIAQHSARAQSPASILLALAVMYQAVPTVTIKEPMCPPETSDEPLVSSKWGRVVVIK